MLDGSGSEEKDDKKYSPTKLVVCGGGVKGRAYVPVIAALEQTKILPNVKDVYGSSIGAILSSMISLGYSPKEIQNQLNADGSPYQDATRIHDPSTFVKAAKALKNMAVDGTAFKGEQLAADCQAMVQKGGLHPNATFAELDAKVQKGEKSASDMPYRNLHITATVSDNRGGSYQIILDAKTAPNMPIALAMRASAALPPVFRPVVITPEDLKKYTQGATEPLVQYDRGPSYHDKNGKDNGDIKLDKDGIKLIDGGLVDNLPQYVVHKDHAPNDDVLSLNLRSTEYMKQKEKFQDLPVTDKNEKANLIAREKGEGKAEQAFKASHKICYPPSRLLASKNDTIDIATENIEAADFTMDTTKQNLLMDNGYKAAAEMLKSKGVTVPTLKELQSPVGGKPALIDPIPTPSSTKDISNSATKASKTEDTNVESNKIKDVKVLLSDIGLGLDKKEEVTKKLAKEAQKQGAENNPIAAKTYEKHAELMDAKITVKEALKELDSQMKGAKKDDKALTQQKKELLALDKRLTFAIGVNRFDAVKSKSRLAGGSLVKRIVKGGSKVLRDSIGSDADASKPPLITDLKQMSALKEEIKNFSAANVANGKETLKNINESIKNLESKSNKSEGQKELKAQLITMKEQFEVKIKNPTADLNDGSIAPRTKFKEINDKIESIKAEIKDNPEKAEAKKQELKEVLKDLGQLQTDNMKSKNKSASVEMGVTASKLEVSQLINKIDTPAFAPPNTNAADVKAKSPAPGLFSSFNSFKARAPQQNAAQNTAQITIPQNAAQASAQNAGPQNAAQEAKQEAKESAKNAPAAPKAKEGGGFFANLFKKEPTVVTPKMGNKN